MTVEAFFRKKRVAKLNEVEEMMKVSGRTALRKMESFGYFTSYNYNSSYYTLKTIPKFDRSNIWIYKGVGFTKLNNLVDLVVNSVEKSKSGYTAEELSELLHTRVNNQLSMLVRGGRLRRARFSESYSYFSMNSLDYREQLLKRQTLCNEEPMAEPGTILCESTSAGLSHDDIVAVLTQMINYPNYSRSQLRASLKGQGVDLSSAAFNELVDVYKLNRYKKKDLRLVSILIEHLRKRGLDLTRQAISFLPSRNRCPQCKEPLRVYKTQPQMVYSVLYGSFRAKVRYDYCPSHCDVDNDVSKVLSYRSDVLAKIVAPSKRYGYDVMTYIGISRFLQARQIDEIRNDLKSNYNIPISKAHASRLSDEFLIRISCLHTSYTSKLKRFIGTQGGYRLHIDGTCETKSSTVFVGLDSVTGWVLISEKISSERKDFITPVLKRLKKLYGTPKGIMRDMATAIENSVKEVFPGVSERICHTHFLRDVGKDILSDDYSKIRQTMNNNKVAAQLNKLRRDIYGPLKSHKPDEKIISSLLEGRRPCTQQVYKSVDLILLITLIDWIMNYPRDSTGLGFPFDNPFVDFYRRCQKVYGCVLNLQRRISSSTFKDARLDTLVLILAQVCDPAYESAAELREVLSIYKAKSAEFNKLRKVLRFYCTSESPLSENMGYNSLDEMRKANKELKLYTRESRRRLKNNRQQSRKDALTIIVKHIEKYWDCLLAQEKPSNTIEPRTNNEGEGSHRGVKHDIRRTSGKKDISREFERLGAYIPLVKNLDNPSYVREAIGSLDNLTNALANLPNHLVIKHQEKFYEDRYGIAYKLRKSINPVALLEVLK
jgi:hypothetical protein